MENRFKVIVAALVLLVLSVTHARSVNEAEMPSMENNEQFSVTYDLTSIDNNKNLNPIVRKELESAKQRYPEATQMKREFTKIGSTYKNVGDAYLDAEGKVINYHLKY